MSTSVGYRDLSPWQVECTDGTVIRGRRVAAEGGAPTLYFLHGNGFSGGVYWSLLRRLIAPYGLITHDIENHGESQVTGRYDGPGPMFSQICEVFDQLEKPDNMVVLGHSLGGAMSTLLAAARPEALRAAILMDPILIKPALWTLMRAASWAGRNPMANAAIRRRALWPDRHGLFQHLNGRGVYRGWREEAFEDFIDHASHAVPEGQALICPPAVEAAIFKRPVWPWAAVRQLSMPTLMLYGLGSYPFFPATARYVRAQNPRITVEGVPGGHCFMLEDPDANAARIRSFLSGMEHGAR